MTEKKRIELEIRDMQQRLAWLIARKTAFDGPEAGAGGGVATDGADKGMVTAKRSATTGTPCFGAVAAHPPTDATPPGSGQAAPLLTRRELEVLKLTVEGYNTKETAYELGVSVKMIETHRKHIKNKLGLKNVAQFVAYAARSGLISLE